MKYVPHVCPSCKDEKYYGVLVAENTAAPKCPNCNRVVVPAKRQ